MRWASIAAFLVMGFATLELHAAPATTADIDALWEYDDPARSEQKFRAALATAEGDSRLELLTQIARTLSLRKQTDQAHRLLDEIAPELDRAGASPRVRYLLERGRAFNAAGRGVQARTNFLAAWDLARATALAGLAVDAAHMIAITLSGTDGDAAIVWNQKALSLARDSSDPKARALIPAVLNNMAWDLHDMGRFVEALPVFEQALAQWRERGRPKQVRFARWSVARCLRSLGRLREALTIQRALEAESGAAGDADVFEEIAELYAAMGQRAESHAYFRRALDALSADPAIVEAEPDRLARLRAKVN